MSEDESGVDRIKREAEQRKRDFFYGYKPEEDPQMQEYEEINAEVGRKLGVEPEKKEVASSTDANPSIVPSQIYVGGQVVSQSQERNRSRLFLTSLAIVGVGLVAVAAYIASNAGIINDLLATPTATQTSTMTPTATRRPAGTRTPPTPTSTLGPGQMKASR